MKKAYLNYGTENQVILWPVKNVDLEAQSIIWEVTIKDLDTGELQLYKPVKKPVKKPASKPSKWVVAKVADVVKRWVQAVKTKVKAK